MVPAMTEAPPLLYCTPKTFGGKLHPFVLHGNPYSVKWEFQDWRDFYHGPRPDFAELVTAMNEGHPVVYCPAKTFGGAAKVGFSAFRWELSGNFRRIQKESERNRNRNCKYGVYI